MRDMIKPNHMKIRLTIIFLILLIPGLNSCKKEEEPDSRYQSVIVYNDGRIISEKHYPPGDSESPRDIRSVTKSIMSTLIGIAIDKGYIQSENDKISNYISPMGENIDAAKANIRICDLLTMSSGIEGNDLTNVSEYNDWCRAENQLKYTLAKSMIHQPGEQFGYNSGASHILSVILTQATGMSALEFARIHLFQPLNINDHYWEKDNQGNYNGSAGLCLTPHDMIKIGQVYLNKGMYNGERIVSEGWINKASTFKITTNNIEPFGPDYGYLWWIGNTHGHNYYFANGYGGQFIVVSPDLNLIVAVTNNWAGLGSTKANQRWYSTLDSIINKIMPEYY